MGLATNIEWADSTINPTTGCEGCELWGPKIKACYAGNLHENRLAKSIPDLYDPDFQNVRLAPGRMMEAARWPSLQGKDRPAKPWLNGLPRMIFVGDMGDFLSKSVSTDYFLDEVLGAIKTPEGQCHFWLLLTKQIARLADITSAFGPLPDNCMALTTITDQSTAQQRLPHLLRVGCKWRGISAEPLLGRVALSSFIEALDWYGEPKAAKPSEIGGKPYEAARLRRAIQWVIVGGESDQSPHDARPTEESWVCDLVEECFATQFDETGSYYEGKAGGVAVFVKQMGSVWARQRGLPDKKGGDWHTFPAPLQIRQVPEVAGLSTSQSGSQPPRFNLPTNS